MDYPKDWQSSSPQPSNLGHQDEGRTLVIHSVCVLPSFQNKGIGTTIMKVRLILNYDEEAAAAKRKKSYIQRITGAQIADRIALLAHNSIVPYVSSLGKAKHQIIN